MDPHRWSLSAYRFFSFSACVSKQLMPPGILLWAIPSFMGAGFPYCQRSWRVICFHRLDKAAMCTHKAWRPQQADAQISSVLLTDALKWKELKPDIILPSPADQNLLNRHKEPINPSEIWLIIQIPSIRTPPPSCSSFFPRLCSSSFSKTHTQHRFTPALTWSLYSHSKISAPRCSCINLEVSRLPDTDAFGLQTSTTGTTRVGVAGCKATSGITTVSDLNMQVA